MALQDVHFKEGGPHITSISLQMDELGVVTITENLECENSDMAQQALGGDASDCPLAIGLVMVTSKSSDRVEAGMWTVARSYSGVIDEGQVGDYKLYHLSSVATQAPIATHASFGVFAGKPKAEINGAVFDISGNFERFKPFIGEGDKMTENGSVVSAPAFIKNRKCGISDYLMPIITLDESKLSLKDDLAANVKNLGFIDAPPESDFLPTFAGRNWVMTKAEPEWVGKDLYKLKRSWALSGDNGWDEIIYTPATA